MNKILKPQTIIPQDLYVPRSADEQIKELIENMGRPGYILVSRQMGKTNLLINAKRNLENEKDIIAYIDLSNKYDTARECFRNIIDTIIETNQDILNEAEAEILERRERLNLTEHKEHNFELRRILKDIKGKLVISLDEIDSLTQANYSDKIFAQIRSVYFDRVNFIDFNRLTYILSGVAEPSDIIKDSSISPFNIGQKIFLGDFTKKECSDFIFKSKLLIDDEIKDRIFYWTNGNPRLTWEICSEIEDIISSEKLLTTEYVDHIVEMMFLNNFNRPPIDHIRTLISKDIKLRDAVIAIKYGKEDTLSDELKSKLYLAGVLDSNYEKGKIRIKNRIIDNALDDEWLSSLETAETLSISIAENSFSNDDYFNAVKQYENLIKHGELTSQTERNYIVQKLLLCHHKLGNYDKVIDCCNDIDFNYSDERINMVDLLLTKANAYQKLKNSELAKEIYLDIINNSSTANDTSVLKAKIYLSKMSLNNAELLTEDSILSTFSSLYNIVTLLKCNSEIDTVNYWLSMLKYFEGKFWVKINSFENASNCFKESLKYIDVKQKILPIFGLLQIPIHHESDPLRLDYFNELIHSIESDDHRLYLNGDDFTVTGSVIREIIIYCTKTRESLDVKRLVKSLSKRIDINDYEFFSLVADSAEEFIKLNDEYRSLLLLECIFEEDRKLVPPNIYFDTVKWISFYDPDNKGAKEIYFQGFQNYVKTADPVDITVYEREIIYLLENNLSDKAAIMCDIILGSDGTLNGKISNRMLPILFLKMNTIDSIPNKVDLAKTINRQIDTVAPSEYKVTRLNKKLVNHIKSTTNKIIVENYPIEQVRYNEKRYNRNDKVKVKFLNGTIIEKKFKQIKEMLDKGECEII